MTCRRPGLSSATCRRDRSCASRGTVFHLDSGAHSNAIAMLFDSSRAPHGRHAVWTYCHVPRGSSLDMLSRIEQQIERFAPGFRERVVARAVMGPADIERHNANFVGGDIAAGAATLGQLFTRPTWRTYSTPSRGLYICSASTPPGVGVHGMCGYFAAQRALREVLRD
jgi:phytoene dehydrogenase-like protein